VEAEQKTETIRSMAQEQQNLSDSIVALKIEQAVQLSHQEKEVLAGSAAQHAEQLERDTAQVQAEKDQSATLQADLAALKDQFSDELRQKEEHSAKLTIDFENCIAGLEMKVETLTRQSLTSDSSGQNQTAMTEMVKAITEQLAAETQKNVQLSAELDTMTQEQHARSVEGGER
jgi:UDP-3-O-acyl-N-acetylglucosamine deacetylase